MSKPDVIIISYGEVCLFAFELGRTSQARSDWLNQFMVSFTATGLIEHI